MESYRYFIQLAYNGSGFHGWQIQPNAHTVQAEIQQALSLIAAASIELTGAGRTDTGVHARQFFAHFDRENLMDTAELFQLAYKLNRFLPSSILINEIFRVQPDIHARFSAITRTYRYYISRQKDPFSNSLSWIYTTDLDVDVMQQAAEIIKEYTDFTCFSKTRTQTKTNDCAIFESYFEQKGPLLIYHVKANRFLRNMVRAIVGTLQEVGKGNIGIEDFRMIIEKGTRSDAGMSVPACGLFLEEIEYPEGFRF
ncbi:MAG: tRNA pseudouridine(38-40) synthase TruA [Lentimicrobium sp.]|nr:tRNA pseudouridine(38-40) synthase TruA [Lentimicrobium sp.]